MASPKVVTTNPDLPRQSSVCSLSSLLAEAEEPSKMDDLLKSIYYSSSSEPNPNSNPNPEPAAASTCVAKEMMASKTMEEVWKEMVTGTGTTTEPQQDKEITLEDFLTKASVPVPVADHDVTTAIIPPPAAAAAAAAAFIPNGTAVAVAVPLAGGGGGGRGRGKKRAVPLEERVVDKATLQKQRRMIKNRESAARSRERKQAYTIELESLVVHLEAENARLWTEQAEKNKQRYKQLMECLIPVVERRKPRRMLRRVNSVQW